MDLRHLVTFRAVVDRGSFSHAAEELELSQPAVSLQIRGLEERLGQRLLDRRGRRVTATEAGELLYRHAQRMIALEADLERELEELGARIGGRLLIGSSTGPGELLLPRLLGAFKRVHPEVGISLVVGDTQTICDRVLADEIELGIVGAARPQRGLDFAPFVSDELVVIAPPEHHLATRDSVGLEELAAEPMLLQQRGSGVRSVLEAALRRAGVRDRDLDVVMELGLQQSVKAAVLDGYGITLVSRLAVEREVADGRVAAVPVRAPGLVRDFSLVQHAGRTPRRVSVAFVEFARERLGASGAHVPEPAAGEG